MEDPTSQPLRGPRFAVARAPDALAHVEQRYLDGVAHALLRTCGPLGVPPPRVDLTVVGSEGTTHWVVQAPSPDWWRSAQTEKARFVRESSPPSKGADIVFMADLLERSWDSASSVAASLAGAFRLARPGGVLLGTTVDGGTMHRRYEAARRRPGGAWVLEDAHGSALMTTRFVSQSGGDCWEASGVHGRAFWETWPPAGAGRWAYAVDRDELLRTAAELGARPHEDAHGLQPALCWNMQQWVFRAAEPVSRAVQDAMTVEGWDSLASRAVFAFNTPPPL